jgi:hypothetical protein
LCGFGAGAFGLGWLRGFFFFEQGFAFGLFTSGFGFFGIGGLPLLSLVVSLMFRKCSDEEASVSLTHFLAEAPLAP